MKVLILTTEYPTKENPNAVPFLSRQVENLKKSGIKADVFHFRAKKNLIHYIKAWVNVRKIIKNKQYDIIHAHFGQSGLVALPSRLPLVVTFHGSDLIGIPGPNGGYSFVGKLLQTISKFVSTQADQVICVSKKLTEFLPHNINSKIIPCGINLDKFKADESIFAKEKLGIPVDKKVIFFPGNPKRPVKNFRLAQEAVSLLKPDSVLLIPAIDIPYENIHLYYNASDVVLFTSFHEGSPTVIKEALACNVPIISTNVGDVQERLMNVEGNYIVPFNAKIIAEKLEIVLKKPYRTEGRASLLSISEERINEELIAVYKSLTS